MHVPTVLSESNRQQMQFCGDVSSLQVQEVTDTVLTMKVALLLLGIVVSAEAVFTWKDCVRM